MRDFVPYHHDSHYELESLANLIRNEMRKRGFTEAASNFSPYGHTATGLRLILLEWTKPFGANTLPKG